MLLEELIDTSQKVAATTSRTAKISLISGLLKEAAADEVPVIVAFLSGELRQRKTNVGWATMQSAASESSPDSSSLSILDVDDTFERIANVHAGTGSSRERERLLRELLARATADEREFIMRLVVGELRQGALEGIMLDAVARAAGLPAADVRRAHMLSGNLTIVAQAALAGGA